MCGGEEIATGSVFSFTLVITEQSKVVSGEGGRAEWTKGWEAESWLGFVYTHTHTS